VPAVQVTMHVPDSLWQAVHALTPGEGDALTTIRRAVEASITASAKRTGRCTGKYRQVVQALSTPVRALRVSARLPPPCGSST
jgi:hypothetical protein